MKKSRAIELLDLVWAGTDHSSNERLNHAMRNALSLAIGAGLQFALGDVAHILSSYRSGYWIGDSDEWVYAAAILNGNMAATHSFEAAKQREPYIADDVDPGQAGCYMHSVRIRQRERLAVGFSFHWKGITLKVTSFADDSSYVNACSYKRVKAEGEEYGRDKVDKRFKITRAEILTERAERKERDTLSAALAAFNKGASQEKLAKIHRALGAKTKSEFAKLPIEKIRKVVAKFTTLKDLEEQEKNLRERVTTTQRELLDKQEELDKLTVACAFTGEAGGKRS